MKTTVKDVMTTRVIWVKKDATFREMAVALREHRVSAFPVIDDDGTVIGVVSEADMLTKEALDDEPGVVSGILHRRYQAKARGVTAGDLMTTAVVAVRPRPTRPATRSYGGSGTSRAWSRSATASATRLRSARSTGTTCWPISRWTEGNDNDEHRSQGRDDHRGGGGQAGDHLQGAGG